MFAGGACSVCEWWLCCVLRAEQLSAAVTGVPPLKRATTNPLAANPSWSHAHTKTPRMHAMSSCLPPGTTTTTMQPLDLRCAAGRGHFRLAIVALVVAAAHASAAAQGTYIPGQHGGAAAPQQMRRRLAQQQQTTSGTDPANVGAGHTPGSVDSSAAAVDIGRVGLGDGMQPQQFSSGSAALRVGGRGVEVGQRCDWRDGDAGCNAGYTCVVLPTNLSAGASSWCMCTHLGASQHANAAALFCCPTHPSCPNRF
jgi:hypothetical protein